MDRPTQLEPDPHRGGFVLSWDGGRTFDVVNNIAICQVYHVACDSHLPYIVCAGFQDKGNWCRPSATLFAEGICKDDWYTISTAFRNYGDVFHAYAAGRTGSAAVASLGRS